MSAMISRVDSNVNATIANLLKNANVDVLLTRLFKDSGHDINDAPILALYRYLNTRYDFPKSFVPNEIQVRDSLSFILRYFSLNDMSADGSPVELTQSVILSYVFCLKVDGNSFFLPIGIVRQLLKMFKVYGIKVNITKRDKRVVSDIDAYLMDICCRGKSEISIPELKPFEDECKKVRVTYNPWFKVDDNGLVLDKPPVTLSNARFRSAEWFSAAQQPVLLVGAGGLGSNIAVSLCRVLGDKKLILLDPDRIEPINLAGQNFGIYDVGRYKAEVVKSQCLNFNPMLHVTAGMVAYGVDTESNLVSPSIYISGLDNMATRALMYSKWKSKVDMAGDDFKKSYLLIDSRLSAETWQIFCIEGNNEKAMKEFEDKWLFSDEEADSTVCSYKQTAFAAQMCAGYVTNLYVNHCFNMTKQPDNPLLRYVPFMTEYDASQMILRFQNI